MTTGTGVTRRQRALAVTAGVIAFGLIGAAILAALLEPPKPKCVRPSAATVGQKSFPAPPCMAIDRRGSYEAVLQTSVGTIRFVMDGPLAPRAINNFVFLARQGFYNGTIFHRVVANEDHAYVQGGDPTGTGRGGPGYLFEAEEPVPLMRYVRGVVAMLNEGSVKSTGSQFFIVVEDWEELSLPKSKPRYSFFGFVRDQESLETLERMAAHPRKGTKPAPPIVLRTVRIEERGRV